MKQNGAIFFNDIQVKKYLRRNVIINNINKNYVKDYYATVHYNDISEMNKIDSDINLS